MHIDKRQIPNFITAIRLLLVAPVVLLLMDEQYREALILFSIAGFSDGIDGLLARRYNWKTELGGILDPIADKTLMIATYWTLAWLNLLPLWLLALVILRDAIIVGGAAAYQSFTRRLEMAPTIISKINTLIQILLIFIVLLAQTLNTEWPMVIDVLIVAVSITILLSGSSYVIEWSRKAR